MARTKKDTRQIRGSINLNGQVYNPGDEEELAERIQELHDDDDEDSPNFSFDQDKELKRLTKLGVLSGFVELDEDEDTEADLPPDLKRRNVRRGEGRRTRAPGSQTDEEIEPALADAKTAREPKAPGGRASGTRGIRGDRTTTSDATKPMEGTGGAVKSGTAGGASPPEDGE